MKVTKITRTQKNNSRCNVFIDGIYSFTCQCRFLEENGIFTDTEFNEEEFDAMQRMLFFSKSLEYLLGILSARDYTEKQILDKLKKRDVPEHVCGELIDYLKQRDYINEQRYLKDYVKYLNDSLKYSNLEKRKKVYLRQFGEEALSNLEHYLTRDSERAAAAALIEKNMGNKSDEQIMQYLSRKGFAYGIVMEEMNNIKKEE